MKLNRIFFLIVFLISGSTLVKEQFAIAKSSKKQIELTQISKGKRFMEYGAGFGNKTTKVGEIFNFKDFSLRFNGVRELNPEQLKIKAESTANEIDGGNSMLMPSHVFTLLEGTKAISELELMMLPYHVYRFEIDQQKFELRNDSSNNTMWIVNIAK